MSEETQTATSEPRPSARQRLKIGYVRKRSDGNFHLQHTYVTEEAAKAEGHEVREVYYSTIDGIVYAWEELCPTTLVSDRAVSEVLKAKAIEKLTDAERKALGL